VSATVLPAFAAGLVFGLSLIVAIGAQNLFVLRQGAARQHVPAVVTICAVSDIVLIAVGVAGAGTALAGRRWLMIAVRLVGSALLLAYGAFAARRAVRGTSGREEGGQVSSSAAVVIGACLAFTWLNPAVWLDTVVLLGLVANTRPGAQWWFGGGAALASIIWFAALGFGARLLAPVLRRPSAWRILDGFVALVMVQTAARVLLGA
jgi:L-lysine exporter family protein LysE/ArgO